MCNGTSLCSPSYAFGHKSVAPVVVSPDIASKYASSGRSVRLKVNGSAAANVVTNQIDTTSKMPSRRCNVSPLFRPHHLSTPAAATHNPIVHPNAAVECGCG